MTVMSKGQWVKQKIVMISALMWFNFSSRFVQGQQKLNKFQESLLFWSENTMSQFFHWQKLLTCLCWLCKIPLWILVSWIHPVNLTGHRDPFTACNRTPCKKEQLLKWLQSFANKRSFVHLFPCVKERQHPLERDAEGLDAVFTPHHDSELTVSGFDQLQSRMMFLSLLFFYSLLERFQHRCQYRKYLQYSLQFGISISEDDCLCINPKPFIKLKASYLLVSSEWRYIL